MGGNSVSLTGLTLTVGGTGTPATGISSVVLTKNGSNLATATLTGSTEVFTFNDPLTASGSVTYLVTVNFTASASGTYAFSLTAGTAVSSQAVQFGGLPVTGATVTISGATFTPTSTPIASSSTKPVIFPNPVQGSGPVSIALNMTKAGEVKVQIFTVAFRMVQEQTFPSEPVGSDVQLNLTDKGGTLLANGLYYVVVTSPSGKTVNKLLIIR